MPTVSTVAENLRPCYLHPAKRFLLSEGISSECMTGRWREPGNPEWNFHREPTPNYYMCQWRGMALVSFWCRTWLRSHQLFRPTRWWPVRSLIRKISVSQLRKVVQHWICHNPSVDDLACYLSEDLVETFGRDGGNISSLWSRARNATRRFSKRLEMGWTTINTSLFIQIGQNDSPDSQTITPSCRQNLEWRLQDVISRSMRNPCLEKQGKT